MCLRTLADTESVRGIKPKELTFLSQGFIRRVLTDSLTGARPIITARIHSQKIGTAIEIMSGPGRTQMPICASAVLPHLSRTLKYKSRFPLANFIRKPPAGEYLPSRMDLSRAALLTSCTTTKLGSIGWSDETVLPS